MNLKFKSSEPDLKFNIQLQLRQINDNILYLTREVDKLVRLARVNDTNKGLQQTVDKYFQNAPDEDIEHIPEDDDGIPEV